MTDTQWQEIEAMKGMDEVDQEDYETLDWLKEEAKNINNDALRNELINILEEKMEEIIEQYD